MAKLVGAFCVPHIPLILSQPNVADKRQVNIVMETFAHISKRLTELDVDTVILIGDDHYTAFGPHCLPSILIGTGDVDGPYEDWLGPEKAPIVNNTELAQYILQYGFDHKFDWAFAKSLTIDHSTYVPYHKMIKDLDKVATIPVYICSGVEPLVRSERCAELGAMLRDAVEAYGGDNRVAIIGTGGLSHWVGAAEMGRVNEEFDRDVLDKVEHNDIKGLTAIPDKYVLTEAGNGALEIKNWIVAVAAAKEYEMELLCYEPIHGWVTGTAMVELKLAS